MDAVLPIVLLTCLVCFARNTDAIRCYDCFGSCRYPFNASDPNVYALYSPSGWCMKIKVARGRASSVIRSPDSFGVCSENVCKSNLRLGFEEAGCCCNTDLCNNSHTIVGSLCSFLGLALLVSMKMILKY